MHKPIYIIPMENLLSLIFPTTPHTILENLNSRTKLVDNERFCRSDYLLYFTFASFGFHLCLEGCFHFTSRGELISVIRLIRFLSTFVVTTFTIFSPTWLCFCSWIVAFSFYLCFIFFFFLLAHVLVFFFFFFTLLLLCYFCSRLFLGGCIPRETFPLSSMGERNN